MIKTSHTIPIILAAFLLSCTGKSNGQPQQPTKKAVVEQPHTAKQQRLAPPPWLRKSKTDRGNVRFIPTEFTPKACWK